MSKYKLVPMEPTPEMLAAGEFALEAGCYVSGVYADMLAAAPAVQGEPAAGNLYAVYLRDNWDGQGDTYWILSRKQSDGVWVSDDSGKPLIQYEGDALLKVVPLVAAPQPVEQQPAPDVAGLVDALRAMIDQAQRVSVCGNFSGDVVVRAIDALAAYRQQGGDT